VVCLQLSPWTATNVQRGANAIPWWFIMTVCLCVVLPGAAGPVSAGTVVKDRYTVKEVLGRGANAITYLATDNTSGKPVSQPSSSEQPDAVTPPPGLKSRASCWAAWQLASLCSDLVFLARPEHAHRLRQARMPGCWQP
jgi:hypothetical protein